jgi:hypothetical protein
MVKSLIIGEAQVVKDTGNRNNTKKIRTQSKPNKPRVHRSSEDHNITQDLTRAKMTDKKVTSALQRIFNQNNEDFDGIDIKLLINKPPQTPQFPFLMVSLAFIKDVIDIPLELTLIGIVFTTVFSLLLGLVLFIWCFGKLRGGWWKKKLISWVWKRYILTIILEFIPFIKIIPVTTIFVFMVHYKETKLVKIANQALEELKKLGLLSFI